MILVTGGTGLVGSHLLYFLLKENKKVRAIHRKSSDLQAVKKIFRYYAAADEAETLFNKIEWQVANITDIPALTDAFKGITHVYHAAAYISFDPKHYKKLKKANVEGTANVVNLCLAHSVKKMCYVSSVATLGTPLNGRPITEETHWNPEEKNNVYAITKYGAEMEIWRGTQEGLDAVIIKPGVIIGEGFWNSGSGVIIKTASKGIPFYTDGSMGVVDVQDVVKAMIDGMRAGLKNTSYIVVGNNLEYKELLTAIAQRFGAKPPKKRAPKWVLLFFSKLDWLVSKIFGTKRKLLKATVNSLYTTSNYDSSKIEAELDFKFTPIVQTLNRVTDRYSSES
ncbi:NAD-dependent epimerase/dehydratase family protein [Marixanthomonas spongiae]|uniref:NAD-dependent epimerase n=1 Tax=Marixanthomonas spongiae TaxID=2174845 RepID=A0A2U0HZK3_9FLAO|nr:NAD-dependent epimerase/dehydratase family protein [Marixanthomonas spongiae]PVW14170.1 NAD-dependent epimerase [Marixanthomonas spongiae]